jgi:hypothetical protein
VLITVQKDNIGKYRVYLLPKRLQKTNFLSVITTEKKELHLYQNQMRELSFVKNTLEGMVHPIPDKQQLFFVDNPRYLFVKLRNISIT